MNGWSKDNTTPDPCPACGRYCSTVSVISSFHCTESIEIDVAHVV